MAGKVFLPFSFPVTHKKGDEMSKADQLSQGELNEILAQFVGKKRLYDIEWFVPSLIRRAIKRFNAGVSIGSINGQYMVRFDGGGCYVGSNFAVTVCRALVDLIFREEKRL